MSQRDQIIATTTMVHARVDEKTKQRATKTPAAMGMPVSGAIRMLLVRVVRGKSLPFNVTIPNATTVRKALRAAGKGPGQNATSPRTPGSMACGSGAIRVGPRLTRALELLP